MILNGVLVVLARFADYSGAMILFGSSFFLLYSPTTTAALSSDFLWTKRLLVWAAVLTFGATLLGFLAQMAGLAGSFTSAMQPATLKAALLEMNFGPSSLVRALVSVLVVLTARWMRAGPSFWALCSLAGAVACASFAWMGHGAATEGAAGWLHLVGDIVHSLAAAGWIGALVVFALLLAQTLSPAQQRGLQLSLAQFSGVGTALVALLIASGFINSAFLVGWNTSQIIASRYGQVLAAKLLLFVLMLTLAATNRFRHTPMLAQSLAVAPTSRAALQPLRRSVMAETGTAFAVLALVSWLGTLAPVTAQ
jgi:putative copper resistance protein D